MREVLLHREMVHTGDLILVNAQFPFLETGTDRFLLPVSFGWNQVFLDGRVARLIETMVSELAAKDTLCPVSGWRSQEEQESIYAQSLQAHGRSFTEKYVAVPGSSEHQTGLAIDLGKRCKTINFLCPDFPYEGICQTFRKQAVFHGLIQRYPQGKESVTGIAHEPWHFRYVGEPHGEIMTSKHLTLEEYHQFLRQFPAGKRYFCHQYRKNLRVYLSYQRANPEGNTIWRPRRDTLYYSVSGDNQEGFLFTEWCWKTGEMSCPV